METLLDFTDLTIKDVTGRLKAIDDRDQPPPSESVTIGGKLLLAEDQWHARQRERKKREASGSASTSLTGHKRQPRKDKGPREHGGADGGALSERKATRDDTCLNAARRATGPRTAAGRGAVAKPTSRKRRRTSRLCSLYTGASS